MSDFTIQNELFWLDFAEETAKIREKEQLKLPYNFNLIDELKATEDAHTRILLKLLSYRPAGEYVFLKSFISMMCAHNHGLEFPHAKIHEPKITFNREHIDGLIEEETHEYAIIIENKINWAADQNQQLLRYLNTVKQHSVPEHNIFVVYLTLDGRKEVSAISLPDWLKKRLVNEKRFIEMNYRDDILPWLKQDILPEIKIKEKLIESGVRQYIDHLEGRLNLRDSEKPIKAIMNKIINEKLLQGKSICEQWETINRSIENIQNLQTDLHNAYDDITNPVIDQWDNISRKYYHNGETHNELKRGYYYQLFLTNISTNIHFEWCPVSEKDLFCRSSYRMVLHVEEPKNSRLMNMLRLARIDELTNKAKEYGYILTFDERGGVDAMYKEYTTPDNTPFAALDDSNKAYFLNGCYLEVNTLKEIIENTFHKFDGENTIIDDLCLAMKECTGYDWRRWTDDEYGWDLVTDFNQNTHRIGIEGYFAVNKDRKIEFRSYITVWDAHNWDIYEKELKEHYPDYDQSIDKKDTSNRVHLNLPAINIGNDLKSWDKEKSNVINHLKETFEYMNQLTSKY